jgi:hypothetical protein
MAVMRDPVITGSIRIGSYPAAQAIAFGAAVVPSAKTAGADTIKPCTAEQGILGFAGRRAYLPRGGYDGFWATYEMVDVVAEYAMALVTPNGANVNIDNGDFLEVAILGDGSTSAHGILEEAGSAAGTTKTTISVARALATVAMGSDSYKVPASDVASGDTTVTMAAGAIAAMGITVGDYILLEDLNAELQVNKVASLTATVIGLVMPSTVSLVNSDSDLVTRLYQVPVEMV